MLLTKHHAEKIRNTIKSIHDEKLYHENELVGIIKDLVNEIKKEHQDIEELILIAFVIQYIYFSDTFNKYFFNTKRKSKQKEYHTKLHREVIIVTEENKETITTTITTTATTATTVQNENTKEVITIELSDTPPPPKVHQVLYKYPIENYTKKLQAKYPPFGTSWYHDQQCDDILDGECLKKEKQFDTLRAIKLPEQRTPEWYAMRDCKITASDGGTVLSENHYEPQYRFILKKTVGLPFISNEFVHHGKKHEENATKIYEYRMNVSTDEFGLIGHFKHNFLGASPDRICNKLKLDGVHKSRLIGRMLEIKCPLVREIKTSGEIIDHICPKYYWIQVQLQLECCDLEECDFWQCEIREYSSRTDFINDTDPNEPFRSDETGFEKGCIIQLLPKKKMNDIIESKYKEVVFEDSKYIYAPKIEMSPLDCDRWVNEKLSEIQVNPEYKEYFFDKVIYWKLVKAHCVTIARDRKWFAESLPKFQQMWNYVMFFKNNKDKLQILTDYIDSRKIKRNKEIMEVVQQLYDTNNPQYDMNIAKILNDTTISENIKKEQKEQDEYMFVNDTPKKESVNGLNKKESGKGLNKKESGKKLFIKTYTKKKVDDDDYMFI
jgi:putative phage-type endonuclease